MELDLEKLAAGLPSYKIGEEIGKGSTGVVLAATHRQLGRDVAIKLLPPELAANPDVRSRFVTEAKLLASFSHVHIVPVFDFVEHDGLCMLVLERLTGGTLQGYARAGIDPPAACAAVLALCSALHYAHERGVLHRDVKPANVLIAEDGMVKVTDFGIAKVLGGTETLVTRAGHVLGTPAYMAPEQATGSEPRPSTDIYGAGTVLYELLSGRLPFDVDANPLQMLYRRVHTDPRALSPEETGVSEEMTTVVMRSLAREPIERYLSANDLGIAIANAAGRAWGSDWLSQAPFRFAGSGAILTAAHKKRPKTDAPPIRETIVDHPTDEQREFRASQLVPVSELLAEAEASSEPTLGSAGGEAVEEASPPAGAPPSERQGPPPYDGDAGAPPPDDGSGPGEPAVPAPRRRGRLPVVLGVLGVLGAIAVAGVVVALVAGGGDDDDDGTTTQASTPSTVATPPITNSSWSQLPPARSAQQQMPGAVVGGQVWLLGGLRDGADGTVPTRNVETFDTAISRWQDGPDLPLALHHSMAVNYKDRLLVMGGYLADGPNLIGRTMKDVYELKGSRWEKIGQMKTPRAAGAAAVVGDRIIVLGGQSNGQPVTQIDVFDGKVWDTATPMPTPREHLAAAADDRFVYAVGGLAEGRDVDKVERYDPDAETWEELPKMPTARNGLGAAILKGRLFAIGGYTSSEVFATTEIYDINARKWSKGDSMRVARHGMAVVTTRGRIYALAGARAPSHEQSTTDAEVLFLG